MWVTVAPENLNLHNLSINYLLRISLPGELAFKVLLTCSMNFLQFYTAQLFARKVILIELASGLLLIVRTG